MILHQGLIKIDIKTSIVNIVYVGAKLSAAVAAAAAVDRPLVFDNS